MASSPVGEDEQTVFVNILKPPEVTTEKQDEVAAIRGSVDLVCLVKANPTAEIHWEHKGRIITGSARTRPRIDQNGNSVLRIRDINLEDQGETPRETPRERGAREQKSNFKIKVTGSAWQIIQLVKIR